MTVHVTTTHIQEAEAAREQKADCSLFCPVAIALKEVWHTSAVIVGVTQAWIDDFSFEFSQEVIESIKSWCNREELTPFTIEVPE